LKIKNWTLTLGACVVNSICALKKIFSANVVFYYGACYTSK